MIKLKQLLKENTSDKIYYHGTNGTYNIKDIEVNNKLFGLFLTPDPSVAEDYGHTIHMFKLKPGKVLNLDDGYDLLSFMIKNEIIEKDELDTDLENYITSGQLYQYDISSRTDYTSEIMKTARSMGYDIVRMIDDLNSSMEDIATVVLNKDILIYIGELDDD